MSVSRIALICVLALASCAPLARAGGPPAVRPALRQTVYLVQQEPRKGWLGIRFSPGGPAPDPSTPGARAVRIVDVMPGSPARRSGLRPGDVIVRYRNEDVTFQTFPRRIMATSPGTSASIILRRGDKELELTVVIGDRGNAAMAPDASGSTMGMLLVRAERIAPGFPRQGLLVEEVRPGSPAERAGIRPGLFVIAVQDVAVDTEEPLRRAAAAQPAGARIVLTTDTGGRLDFYVLLAR